ncbi:MAG: NAD-dependent epimerase/dehydratase family protein [Mariniphaga sp.]
MNTIVYEDIKQVIKNLGSDVYKFEGKKVLITGYKGFLGANYCAFFSVLNREVFKHKSSVVCMDNNIVDLDDRVSELTKGFQVINGNGVLNLPEKDFNYVIHCAGIASPTYYRKYPLETISVNAIGYWDFLNNLNHDILEGFLYFSTSEIYGDPDNVNIPTPEDYRGNVSCTGPRACYDESKRLGETISISFYQQKGLPVKIVRPFNVYGPFMRLNDKRVIPDFVKYAFEKGVIKLFSDGKPTRAFCYISDALTGFTKVLLIGKPGRPYNVGNDTCETSMWELAELVANKIGNVKYSWTVSEEKDYLTDNPNRRCPVIKRAKEELGYQPFVNIEDGLTRVINWYKEIYFNNKK